MAKLHLTTCAIFLVLISQIFAHKRDYRKKLKESEKSSLLATSSQSLSESSSLSSSDGSSSEEGKINQIQFENEQPVNGQIKQKKHSFLMNQLKKAYSKRRKAARKLLKNKKSFLDLANANLESIDKKTFSKIKFKLSDPIRQHQKHKLPKFPKHKSSEDESSNESGLRKHKKSEKGKKQSKSSIWDTLLWKALNSEESKSESTGSLSHEYIKWPKLPKLDNSNKYVFDQKLPKLGAPKYGAGSLAQSSSEENLETPSVPKKQESESSEEDHPTDSAENKTDTLKKSKSNEITPAPPISVTSEKSKVWSWSKEMGPTDSEEFAKVNDGVFTRKPFRSDEMTGNKVTPPSRMMESGSSEDNFTKKPVLTEEVAQRKQMSPKKKGVWNSSDEIYTLPPFGSDSLEIYQGSGNASREIYARKPFHSDEIPQGTKAPPPNMLMESASAEEVIPRKKPAPVNPKKSVFDGVTESTAKPSTKVKESEEVKVHPTSERPKIETTLSPEEREDELYGTVPDDSDCRKYALSTWSDGDRKPEAGKLSSRSLSQTDEFQSATPDTKTSNKEKKKDHQHDYMKSHHSKPKLSSSAIPEVQLEDVLPKFQMYKKKLQKLIDRMMPNCPEIHGLKLLRTWIKMFHKSFPNYISLDLENSKFTKELKRQLSLCFQRLMKSGFGYGEEKKDKNRQPTSSEEDHPVSKRAAASMDLSLLGESFQTELASPLVKFFEDTPDLVKKIISERDFT